MILKDFLFYLQTCTIDAHTKLVQNQISSNVEVHSTRLEIELALKTNVTCEYDAFTNIVLMDENVKRIQQTHRLTTFI
jgi:hypothetical protein